MGGLNNLDEFSTILFIDNFLIYNNYVMKLQIKRKDLNALFTSIKEGLFLNSPDRRNNLLNLLDGARFEEINENTGTAIFSSVSSFSKDVLNSSEFKNEVQRMSKEVLNSDYKVIFVLRSEWEKRNVLETTSEINLIANETDSLKQEFTLDTFLVPTKGENNMVKQASMAVSLKPGEYTPFFIYGGSGLGKTHLLHGIGNKIKETYPNFSIKYLESKDFKNLIYEQKINTVRVRGIHNEFLSYDVLLIDDIQMLQSLPKAKEVFFDILSNFINEKKQIVITSDQYPEEMIDFEERFTTRFKGGVLLSVTPPDVDTAKMILLQKLEKKDQAGGIKLDDAALSFIATNFGSNIRELEGSINKILFWSITNSQEREIYNIQDVMEIFEGMTTSRGLTIQHIVSVVAKNYQLKTSDILGRTRKSEIALARHISIYFSRTILEMSLMDIGRYFSRDHSTIISSIKKIEKNSSTDQKLGRAIYDLRKKIISSK